MKTAVAAVLWLPGCPTGDLPQLPHAPHDGPVPGPRGLGGPSTAELPDVTGQVPITQLLRCPRVRWLGHAASRPETTMGQTTAVYRVYPGVPQAGRPPPLHVDG